MENQLAYDVVIVGGGPIGLACGIEARKAGLRYIILEKGCLVNSLYHYPMNMTFFSTSERLEIGNVPFISHGPKPNRVESLEYYRRVCQSWELSIRLYETVESIHSNDGNHVVTTAKGIYTAPNVVLALGFYDLPYLLNVPGEDLPKVRHYYDEPHPYFRQRVVVVGASNSAVDVALETFRKGADVTMIVRDGTIGESVKYWVRPDIENRIKESSIRAYFNSQVTRITTTTVEIATPDGNVVLDNDFVLAMTGYQPPFEFLAHCGINFHNDDFHTPFYNEGSMETNVPGIFLAGVVCGGLKTNKWFIENSRIHANQIVDHIINVKQKH
jgi:thioredoxin reductase (NADPH)